MENLKFDTGLMIVEAVPVQAFAGAGDRVHATERAALIDKATNGLASVWLEKCEVGMPSFSKIMEYVETNPELFEAAARLARFKNAQ